MWGEGDLRVRLLQDEDKSSSRFAGVKAFVAGATTVLGYSISHSLLAQGVPVRALVQNRSDKVMDDTTSRQLSCSHVPHSLQKTGKVKVKVHD